MYRQVCVWEALEGGGRVGSLMGNELLFEGTSNRVMWGRAGTCTNVSGPLWYIQHVNTSNTGHYICV